MAGSTEVKLKKIAWTELEVGAIVAGAVWSNQMFDERKFFKKDFEEHPAWFMGDRADAPWYIKWSGALKALGAVAAATFYVTNAWIKLLLYGVAFQGTLQQVRIWTWNKDTNAAMFDSIGQSSGSAKSLDAKLRDIAERYRATNGPQYLGAVVDQYSTAVSGAGEPLSQRYDTSVSGPVYIEGEWTGPMDRGPYTDSNDVTVAGQ